MQGRLWPLLLATACGLPQLLSADGPDLPADATWPENTWPMGLTSCTVLRQSASSPRLLSRSPEPLSLPMPFHIANCLWTESEIGCPYQSGENYSWYWPRCIRCSGVGIRLHSSGSFFAERIVDDADRTDELVQIPFASVGADNWLFSSPENDLSGEHQTSVLP